MKVILNQMVPNVGKEGQIVVVADGYARNYLFPRGMAILADKAQIQALERRNARMAAKLAETKAEAEALKEKIDGKSVRIEAKVGRDTNKLFGAITSQDVADAIQTQLGVTLEKKQIGLIVPIKRLGEFKLDIDLHREVDAKISLSVFNPDAPVEAAKPAETDEQAPQTESETETVTV